MAVKSITKGNVKNFSLPEFMSVTERVRSILMDTKLQLLPAALVLDNAKKEFDDAYQASKVKISTSLEAEDEKVDKAYNVISSVVHALVDTPNAIGEAANRIADIFGRWDYPTRLPYAKEYGIMKALIEALNGLDPSDFDVTATRYWFDALREHYEAFMSRWQEVNTQKSVKETGITQATRKAWNAAYLELIDYLNMRLRYDSAPEIESAADKLNVMIAEFKMSKRTSGNKAETEEPTEA